jgi:GntR family transcriptional regulator
MAVEQAVADRLRQRLLADSGSGVLPPGSRLGSERELSEHYGVSRATLRQVLAALEEARLVRRVPGRAGGTFVNDPREQHELDRVVGVPAFLVRQGYVAGSRVISTRMHLADDTTRKALRLEDGALVIEIRRIGLADATPVSLDQAWFPADRFGGLMELPLGSSLDDLLEKEFATSAADAEEVVEVVHATKEEAALLSVGKGAPLLQVTRVTYDPDGVPFEHSRDLFRADRTRIAMRSPGWGLRRGIGPDQHHVTLSSVADAS